MMKFPNEFEVTAEVALQRPTQHELEDEIRLTAELIQSSVIIVGCTLLAFESDYETFFSNENCRVVDAAHLISGVVPNAIQRVKEDDFCRTLIEEEGTRVGRLAYLYSIVSPEHAVPEQKLRLLNTLVDSVGREISKKQHDLERTIKLGGIVPVKENRSGDTLITVKDLCTWVAANFLPVNEHFKRRARLVIKGTTRDELHTRHKTFYEQREQTLKAAVQVLAEEILAVRKSGKDKALTARELRDKIDTYWPTLYPDGDGCPPLGIEASEELISSILKQAKLRIKKSGSQ